MNNTKMIKKNIALILAGGRGSRVGSKVEKQLIYIDSKPILAKSVENFLKLKEIDEIVIVCPKTKTREYEKILLRHLDFRNKNVKNLHFIEGGNERNESSLIGVNYIYDNFSEEAIILIHDGARPYVSEDIIRNCIRQTWDKGNALVCVKPKDTIRKKEKVLDRASLYVVQTPQCFEKNLIHSALNKVNAMGVELTDDASALDYVGVEVNIINGSYENIKITTKEDIPNKMRIGSGFDVHKLEEGKTFILGGVKIESPFGMVAHSDGDVLVHAIMDSLLGACGLGDIGRHFPDNDDTYKDISSMILLSEVNKKIGDLGWEIVNIDATVICEKPKIAPHVYTIRENISSCLNIDIEKINIKATTTEKLGYTGRGEGIASESVCLLQSKQI